MNIKVSIIKVLSNNFEKVPEFSLHHATTLSTFGMQ